MRGDGPGDGLSGGDGEDRHSDDPAQKTVIRESRIDKGNMGGGDGNDGDLRSDSEKWENDPMRFYRR